MRDSLIGMVSFSMLKFLILLIALSMCVHSDSIGSQHERLQLGAAVCLP